MSEAIILLDGSIGEPSKKKAPAVQNPLRLTDVFRPNCIEVVRPGSGKSSVLSLLVRILARDEHIDREHSEQIIRELMERERHGSSAIGRGLAVPHLRTKNVTHFVGAIAVAPEGIQFGALDGQPTRLVLLTLSPWEGREAHTELLSRLVSLTQDTFVSYRLNHDLDPTLVYSYLSDLDGSRTPDGSDDGRTSDESGRR